MYFNTYNYNDTKNDKDEIYNSEHFDDYKKEIVDALEGNKKFTNTQHVSPVHFLRDRELGLHASQTSKHFVTQRVNIYTAVPRYWPVREKIYRRMLKECKEEEEEKVSSPLHFLRDRELGLCVSQASKRFVKEKEKELFGYKKTYYDYTTKIIRKLERFDAALCISIHTDIEKCVGLVINNLRPFRCKRWRDIMVQKYCDDNDIKILRCMHSSVYKICFERYKYICMHSDVQESERYCLSCAKVTCKCPIENCDIV